MGTNPDLNKINSYFSEKFSAHGSTPMGLDWNSEESQYKRFEQIAKVIDPKEKYSLIDYGCGYGALYDYLKKFGHDFIYTGYDIVEKMISDGKDSHAGIPDCHFTTNESDLTAADYVLESGVFNIKLNADYKEWTDYTIKKINKMNTLAKKGLAFNMLTSYSDQEYMRSNLYYADPCFFFDYCKRNFSRNVALLHDYELYDFTIIVRKD